MSKVLPSLPSYRVLLIGIDAYPNAPLAGCVNDIDRLEAFFLDRLRVPAERIFRLAAAHPGRPSTSRLPSLAPTLFHLEQYLARLAQDSTPEDRVYIHYSGHGWGKDERREAGESREALVPVDYLTAQEPWRLLEDQEVHRWLCRIAERTPHLTVVLDCCHAADTWRDAPRETGGGVRYLAVPEDARPGPRQAGPLSAMAGGGERGVDAAQAERPYVVLSACALGEKAREIPIGESEGRREGALTHALLELLGAVSDEHLEELRWVELWPALQARLGQAQWKQHPRLSGHLNRRVFGGPWRKRDVGLILVRRPEEAEGRVEIAAGSMLGVSAGARVAVYGATPDDFPPLGSAEDLAARRGLLRVIDGNEARAWAVVEGAWAWPPEARGRLVQSGPADRLRVELSPWDPELAAALEARGQGLLRLVSPAEAGAEVWVRRDETGRFHVRDEALGEGRWSERSPLAPIAGERVDGLVAMLRHYARYNASLRLARRAVEPANGLKVELLDASGEDKGGAQGGEAKLPAFTANHEGLYVLPVGTAFCVRVENQLAETLHVALLNCTASGKVEFLEGREIPPGSTRVFRRPQQQAEPLRIAFDGPGVRSAIDRLVVVGTSRMDVDFSSFAVDQPFPEDSQIPSEGERSVLGPVDAPKQPWMATLLPIHIVEDVGTRGSLPGGGAEPKTGKAGGRKKIAILGGGMGSLAAAFELTHQPGWQEAYEITVYQLGWRLGGKGASGRNRAMAHRIEEHGLHIWMGFYENAFRLIRDCYGDPRRPRLEGDFTTWEDAFKPHRHIVLEERLCGPDCPADCAAHWRHWPLDFPLRPGTPGDGQARPGLRGCVGLLLGWLKQTAASSLIDLGAEGRGGPDLGAGSEILSELDAAIAVYEQAAALADSRDPEELETGRGLLDRTQQLLTSSMNKLRQKLAANDTLRRTWILCDLGTTHVRGLVADGLAFSGDFTAIDDQDYKAWLRAHGAEERTVESAPVNALYDLVFSLTRGIAAGTTIVCAMRMLFTYAGAIFYKMQAGMGDVVFAPLYQVLKQRGVRFCFFHRVEALRLSEDGQTVAAIEMAEQARLRPGLDEYEPLYTVEGLWCWPSEPLWEQLEHGAALAAEGHDFESFWNRRDVARRTLVVGKDFDLVVLGIPPGALPHIASELMAAQPRFGAMVENLKTCRTQAMQLWLERPLAELGWVGEVPVQGSYAEPYDTWADMSHLLGREGWAEAGGPSPKNIAYFCGYLDEETAEPAPATPEAMQFEQRERARAQGIAEEWLRRYIGHLWPHVAARHAGEPLDAEALFDPAGRQGVGRLAGQYFRANINPSDRYVLSVPGSTRYRLRADESGCTNLYLAGDWLRTGLDGGCIEAATMGGMQACQAIWRDLGFSVAWPRPIVGGLEVVKAPTAEPARVVAARSLPRFIERHGDVVFQHPYTQRGTRLCAWMLPSSYAALEALCERYLDLGGETVYQPAAPVVMLVAADIAESGAGRSPHRERGFMPERDVSFWVPVIPGTRDHGAWRGEEHELRLAWFLPYVWVDSGIAMAAGREVFGFPKGFGEIWIPAEDPACFSVHTSVLERFAADSRVRSAPVVEVVRQSGSPKQLFQPSVTTAAELASQFQEGILAHWAAEAARTWRLCLSVTLENLLPRLGMGVVPLVFLKQFRDIADPTRACYQAVVEAPARTTRFHRGGLLKPSDYRVRIHTHDSHPIARELGLGERSVIEHTPMYGFWLEFDFEMELGREIVAGR